MTKSIYWIMTAFILAAALFAANAKAEQASCTAISTLAETIMTARQQGVPMSRMMDSDLEIVKTMVIQAYDKPRYSTAQFQQREIADFRDFWHLACVRARG